MTEVQRSAHSTHMLKGTENAEENGKMDPSSSMQESLSCRVCLIVDFCKQGKSETLTDYSASCGNEQLYSIFCWGTRISVDCRREAFGGLWRKEIEPKALNMVNRTETLINRIKWKWCEAGGGGVAIVPWRGEVFYYPESLPVTLPETGSNILGYMNIKMKSETKDTLLVSPCSQLDLELETC